MIEIACFSLEAALIAQDSGANRIEFCVDKSLGGISPSYSLIQAARQAISLPLYVMIRPRGGDFIYNEEELDNMKATILFCKEIGINGLVFGVMNEDDTIDIKANKILVEIASPLSCTFHRAFDIIQDKSLALEQLIDCGFQCVLTSGGIGNAIDFLFQLTRLIQQANNRITLMPGGGIRSDNAALILQQTKAKVLHSAAIISGDLPDKEEIYKLTKYFTPI